MAFTPYNGTPPDTYGSDGDIVFDYANRFYWGPKGQQTAGSWTGTAFNAQGPTGPGILAGTGAPASAYGNVGNGYVDLVSGALYLKSASGWAQAGTLPTAVGQRGSKVWVGQGDFVAGNYPSAAAGDLYINNTPGVNAVYTLG